jgi:four helix bundle protein
MNTNNFEFGIALQDRAWKLASDTFNLLGNVRLNEANRDLIRQIRRSVTSLASNYSAANRSRSVREFYSKLSIAVEECDETLRWIRFGVQIGEFSGEAFSPLENETLSILKILAKARETLKERIYGKGKSDPS